MRAMPDGEGGNEEVFGDLVVGRSGANQGHDHVLTWGEGGQVPERQHSAGSKHDAAADLTGAGQDRCQGWPQSGCHADAPDMRRSRWVAGVGGASVRWKDTPLLVIVGTGAAWSSSLRPCTGEIRCC